MRACADEFLATATEGAFRTTPLTTNYTICSVNDTPILKGICCPWRQYCH